MEPISIGYDEDAQYEQAEALAKRLNLMINTESPMQLRVTAAGLLLKIPPFLPLSADFSAMTWRSRREAGKKQGLVRACKPKQGSRIIDATAGWGRDAAVLASLGAEVLMLERNPVMAALLEDALDRAQRDDNPLNLKLESVDSINYLQSLKISEYPDVIYIDPMHPVRQKSALVKKDMQALQQLIGFEEDSSALISLAKTRVLQRVVVKWPQNRAALLKPDVSIEGKTVRFDIYQTEI